MNAKKETECCGLIACRLRTTAHLLSLLFPFAEDIEEVFRCRWMVLVGSVLVSQIDGHTHLLEIGVTIATFREVIFKVCACFIRKGLFQIIRDEIN